MPKQQNYPALLQTNMGYKKLNVNAWKKIILDVIDTDLIGNAFKEAKSLPIILKNHKVIDQLLAFSLHLENLSLFSKEQHKYLKILTEASNELIREYAESKDEQIKPIISELLPALQRQANAILLIPEQTLNQEPSFIDCLASFFKCYEKTVDEEPVAESKKDQPSRMLMS
jgi:hypothetical protein